MAHKITQGWAAPAFWKRWLISMVAVYPPLVVLVFAFRALFRYIPTLLSLFLIAACPRCIGGWVRGSTPDHVACADDLDDKNLDG